MDTDRWYEIFSIATTDELDYLQSQELDPIQRMAIAKLLADRAEHEILAERGETMPDDPGNYRLIGRVPGDVCIWRSPVTRDLYWSRGAGGMHPLDVI